MKNSFNDSADVGYVGPATSTEQILAEVLAGVVRAEEVSVHSHFFDDLDADSMVMARFCARVRKRPDVPPVSMKDIYHHPTIRQLATALTNTAPGSAEQAVPVPADITTPASTPQYVLCGALQLLIFVGYSCLAALAGVQGYEWISAGSGPIDAYLRSVLFGGGVFVGLCIQPVLAKWVFAGRWRSGRIRVWSLAYVRFWAIKTLVRSSPLVLFTGSPLYVLYLRALGAKIGRGVVILSRNVPVCTDLLSVGDGTVIRKDAFFPCYRAHAGMIQTGTVTLGKDVVVREATVIDIDTSLGDGAQLGHASSLHTGQAVPANERWHGSPARPADVDYRGAAAPTGCGTVRKSVYSVLQLLSVLVLYAPLSIGGVAVLLAVVSQPDPLLGSGSLVLTNWTFYIDALTASFLLFFGFGMLGLVFVVTVPRVLNLAIEPGKVYPLYGLHYSVQWAIERMTNLKFFTTLFGDSSYIVHYLRCLGYDLSHVDQTGSNFGTEVRHETPYLSSVGRGTMVADGLSIINADYSSTSFCVSRVSIGPHNFLGNRITYPRQGRTGDDCLLATKVMVPIDGPIRAGVGLLGSPCFEIPRSVERDSTFDHLKSGDELRRRLTAKNNYNLRSMGLFLLVRWFHFFGITLLASIAADLYRESGALVIPLDIVLSLLFTFGYFALVERAVARFRALSPRFCSIYDPYFWWHERFWKLVIPELTDKMLSGTPFKNVLSRLLGVRLGRRVFDDGCFMPERTLVTIGDDCTLNAGSVIQGHSQEDGTFKSGRSTIGARCTLGVGAFVHYGVTMGDGAVLAPDSFLMKGEEVPPHARWGGNPAGEVRDNHHQPVRAR